MTSPAVQDLWVYLATSPLFWLGLTLAAVSYTHLTLPTIA